MIAPDCDDDAAGDELVAGYWRAMDGTLGPATKTDMEEAERWARIWIAMREDKSGRMVWD
jgi:hypothetical protein